MLPVFLLVMVLLTCWSAVGCYALQEYAYSRLEELCDKRNVPDRFRHILTQQEMALVGLELLLTLSTLGLSLALCLWIGWPAPGATTTTAVLVASVFEYIGALLLVLFVAEILPWTVARVASEPFLVRCWPAIRGVQILFTPLLSLARQMDRAAHRLVGRGEPEDDDASVINEEIRTVVDEGEKEGLLESDASAMIYRVMALKDEDVGAIMTPRTDMFCIGVESTLEEARVRLIEAGHSRIPIIGGSTDDIQGILYAKDLLKAIAPETSETTISTLRDILREPFYIPVTTQIPALLELMKRQKVQIAMVLDEYGGVAGLVTMEDILEEIVGEIEDEYDEDETVSDIHELAPNRADVDARVHIDDLNRRFDFGLPEDGEFDTIGGFVFSQLGRVPRVGEVVEWELLKITILAADKRRATRLRLELPSAQGKNAATESESPSTP